MRWNKITFSTFILILTHLWHSLSPRRVTHALPSSQAGQWGYMIQAKTSPGAVCTLCALSTLTHPETRLLLLYWDITATIGRLFPYDPLNQLASITVWMGSYFIQSLAHLCVEYDWPLRDRHPHRQDLVFWFWFCWLCKLVLLTHLILLEQYTFLELQQSAPKEGNLARREKYGL